MEITLLKMAGLRLRGDFWEFGVKMTLKRPLAKTILSCIETFLKKKFWSKETYKDKEKRMNTLLMLMDKYLVNND